MISEQQQKFIEVNDRPPRSFRASKTSQGPRPRHQKPLLPDNNSYQEQDVLEEQGITSENYQSKNGGRNDPYQYSANCTFSMPQTSTSAQQALLPFQHRSFNGLQNDAGKRTHKRKVHQRKNSGQVTLFHQIKSQAQSNSNNKNNNQDFGPEILARDSSSHKLRRSTMSNRSRSSSRSRGGTPQRKGKKSLNFGNREKAQNAISSENMRFVSRLVNVKSTVPSGLDIVRRDSKNKKLRQNLVSSFNGNNQTGSKIATAEYRRSRQGTPTSVKSEKRKMTSPKVDSRLQSKGLANFFKIQQSSSPEPFGTPPHLKLRQFDSKNLAQMYEADDHLLFGSKQRKKKRGASDTASQRSKRSGTSSQISSIQGSKRRKKKIKRRFVRENVSQAPYVGQDYYDTKKAKNLNNTVEIKSGNLPKTSQTIMAPIHKRQLADQPIAEHPGPKPNPAGYSLIQKMNNLMTQKQSEGQQRPKNYSKTNIADQVMEIVGSEQENQAQNRQTVVDYYGNIAKNHPIHKKSYVLKESKSIPRHQSKRKSMHETFNAQPFGMHIKNQKAAMLTGYYNTSAQLRGSSKNKKSQLKSQYAGATSLPPRNVKTATIRKNSTYDKASFDYMPSGSIKTSPISNTAASYKKQTVSSKRRIIVAVNKEHHNMDMMARNTDSGWNKNRQRLNMTVVEESPQDLKPSRPEQPLSAHPLTSTAAQAAAKPPRQVGNHQQQHKAYQDIRKRHLTDKLFSPVLRSQISSGQVSASAYESNNGGPQRQQSEDRRGEMNENFPQAPEIIMQSRPRVTRTAEGGTRARMKNVNNRNASSDLIGGAHDDSDTTVQNDMISFPAVNNSSHILQIEGHTPQVLSSNKWLVPHSSNGETSVKTIASQGFTPITDENLKNVLQQRPTGGNYLNNSSVRTIASQGIAPIIDENLKNVLQKRPTGGNYLNNQSSKLNVESKETFNHIASAHNIKEDVSNTASQQILAEQSSKYLFSAPKQFNQISEEGGDGDSDNKSVEHYGTKKLDGAFNIDLQEAEDEDISDTKTEQDPVVEVEISEPDRLILEKNYPKLI